MGGTHVKKTMLRAVVGSSLCAVALVGTAGAASAGEITGNGKFKTVNANSLCAYSGQNDGYHDPTHQEGPEDTGRVQSYGQIVRAGGKAFAPSPSIGCNPNRGFPE
jgi:hypothetical protein